MLSCNTVVYYGALDFNIDFMDIVWTSYLFFCSTYCIKIAYTMRRLIKKILALIIVLLLLRYYIFIYIELMAVH